MIIEIERRLGLRALHSFGVMKVTIGYLELIEQLSMQRLCKWFYAIGAGRVQTSIRLARMCYFSTFYESSLK